MSSTKGTAAALIRKEALTSAVANFVINAAIQAWLLFGKGPHVVTVDSIGSPARSVFGSAVMLAASLGLIVGSINFFTFRKKAAALGLAPVDRLARPYFFFGLRQALRSVLALFGAVVVLGVLWQRYVGSIEVSTPVAALFGGLVAAIATWYAATRICWALLREDSSNF